MRSSNQPVLANTACFIFVVVLFTFYNARAGEYFQDFSAAAEGATNFGDGSGFFSTIAGAGAGITDPTYKELQFAQPSSFNTRSAFILPALEPAAPVTAFSAKFNAVIYGTYPAAGDGFSFSFGQFSADDGLISTNFSQEAGYSNGLCFSVQTHESPGFYLRVDGRTIASIPYDPSVQWGTNNPARHFFEIDWNTGDGVTVRMDHQTLFANVAAGDFIPRSGDRFVFAARTSSYAQYFRIDNVLAVTGGNLNKLSVGSPFYRDPNWAQFPSSAFDNNFTTPYWTEFYNGCVGGTLSSPKNVKAYAITTYALGSSATQPQTWRLEGSYGGETWGGSNPVTIGKFINGGETRSWLATDEAAYPAWRLNVFTNNGGSEMFIEELELFEMAPQPPDANAVNDQGNFGFLDSNYPVHGQCFAFTVYPQGPATAVTFEWGPTTAYGNSFSADTPATNGSVTLNAPLGFPEGDKDYHYRITLQNTNGTVQTADQVFHLPAFRMLDGRALQEDVLNNAVIAADFNGDEKMDLLNSGVLLNQLDFDDSRRPNTFIRINNLDGSAVLTGGPALEPFPTGTALLGLHIQDANDGAVVVNDFNNDDRLDLYLNGWYSVYYDGTAQVPQPDTPLRQYLFPGYEPKVDPFTGATSPTGASRNFAPITPSNMTAGRFSHASTADFNGDGRIDLLLTITWPQGTLYETQYPNTVLPPTLYLNRAHGYCTPFGGGPERPGLDQVDFLPVACELPYADSYAILSYENHTVEADYDNDGNIDVYNCPAGLYRNNGYGQFTVVTNLPSGAHNAAWGDFNNDGKLDIILTLGAESRLYRNDGGGQFTDMGLSFPGIYSDAPGLAGLSPNEGTVLAWADIDHNGWPDLYIRGYNSTNYVNTVYFNTNGVFTPRSIGKPDPLDFYDGLDTTLSRTGVTFADFNKDGRLDIAECASEVNGILWPHGSQLWFVFNLLGSSNRPPDAPVGLTSASGPGAVTLNWGNATDDVTPSAALTYNLRVGTTPGGCDIASPMAKTNGFRLVSSEGNRWLAHTTTLRLQPGTYYWSVQAVDGGFLGGQFAAEQSFTIADRGMPYVYQPQASDISSNSATVSAGAWTSYDNAICWIEYGLSTAYGQTNSLSLVTNETINYHSDFTSGSFTLAPFQPISLHTASFNLTSLLSGRDYHYRFAVSNSVGIVYGADAVFTTLGNPPPKLSIALTNDAVLLAWTNSATGFTLEETPALNVPAWNPVLITPVNTNGMFQVRVPVSGSEQFFRLRQP
jgi:hypothetical protein